MSHSNGAVGGRTNSFSVSRLYGPRRLWSFAGNSTAFPERGSSQSRFRSHIHPLQSVATVPLLSSVLSRSPTGSWGGNVPLGEVAPLVKELKVAAEAAGRNPNTLHIISRGVFQIFESPQGKDRRPLWGTLGEIREDIERYAEAGLTELFLEANLDPNMTVERVLEVMIALAPRHPHLKNED